EADGPDHDPEGSTPHGGDHHGDGRHGKGDGDVDRDGDGFPHGSGGEGTEGRKRNANDDRDEARADRDDDGRTGARHEQREDVSAGAIGSERVRPARRRPGSVRVGAGGIEWRPDERDGGDQHDSGDDEGGGAAGGDAPQVPETVHARSLSRGSTAWWTRSTTKPVTRTNAVSTKSSLCTIVRSRAPTSATSMRPMPGSENTCSTTTAPTMIPAICTPRTVMIERPTAGRPCRTRAWPRVSPLAAAVRTKSSPVAESVALRTKRISRAPSTTPIVSEGSTSARRADPASRQPARGKPCAGNQSSPTAKTTTSMRPAHTTGTAASSCALTLRAAPEARSRRCAPRMPSGIAMTSAISSEKMPSGIVTRALSASCSAAGEPVTSDE